MDNPIHCSTVRFAGGRKKARCTPAQSRFTNPVLARSCGGGWTIRQTLTSLTEAGEHTDPFTLQYVAGHDNIKTTVRYVHPREAAVHKLFARLADLQRPEERMACKKSVQNPVQLEMPSPEDLAKLWITSNLQRAEVVELADTPS
jgi:hypothetical protein